MSRLKVEEISEEDKDELRRQKLSNLTGLPVDDFEDTETGSGDIDDNLYDPTYR